MGAAATIPSTGLSLFSLGMQRDAEAGATARNANELLRQAQFEDANAVDALRRGALAAGQVRHRAATLVGAQRSAYADANIDTSSGTAARNATSTLAMAEVDAQTLENNAVREAWGRREVGRKYRAQKADLEAADASANAAVPLQALSTLLGGAGKLGS